MTTLSPLSIAPRALTGRYLLAIPLALALVFALSFPIAASAEAVEPLTASISLDKTTVAVGETVTATWSISGGRAPYSIWRGWYVFSGGADICKAFGTLPSGTTTSSFSPELGETCRVLSEITDADGRKIHPSSDTIPVTGAAPVEPLIASISLDKTAVVIGETVTATWSISGGRPPYSIWRGWYVFSGGADICKASGTLPSGATTSSFSPELGETCRILSDITDADGRKIYPSSIKIPVYSIYASGIELNADSATLDIGKTKQLTATITPSSGTIQTVSWSSNDHSVATVDGNGLVTAVGEGTAIITAATTDGSDLSATCDITVNPPIPVTTVTIDEPGAALYVGGKIKLTATVLPENASYKTLSWTSSDSSVATVADGVVTGVAKGTATITATSTENKDAKAERTVTVSSTASRLRALAYNPGITIASPDYLPHLSFTVGAQCGTPPYALDVSFEKDGAVVATTSFATNSSSSICCSGTPSPGAYTIRVNATDAAGRVDSASASVNILRSGGNLTVTILNETRPVSTPTGLSFQNPTLSVEIGKALQLSPTVSPANAPRPRFEWASSNPAAVTVSDTGVVTGVAKGSSVVTASATDGSGLSARCAVTAFRPVSSVTLNQQSAKLTQVGQTVTLTATVLPADADNSVTWSTDDASIATVSGGVVTAEGDGTATITAAAKDGSGIFASCAVTVDTRVPVASVSIAAPGAPLYPGGKVRLNATVLPANATDKALTWTTSDASVATVSDGMVTGLKKGSATITATANSGAKAECTVTIAPTASKLRACAYDVELQGESWNSAALMMYAQYGTPPYHASFALYLSGSSQPLEWNTSGMTFTDGPMGFGFSLPATLATYTAAVTVTDAAGRTDTASTTFYLDAIGSSTSIIVYSEVRPISAVASISFQNANPSVAIGRTLTLVPTVSPSGMAAPSYEWTSSNPAAVTVSDTGVVTGVGKGSSVVTATATDGSGLSASCTVTAYRDVDSVSLNRTDLKLIQGETATLTATVLPADAGFKSVAWASTNPSVASVNGGVVTGLKDGTAVIAASSSNGKYASCSVTVSNRIESVNVTLPENPPLVRGAYELNVGAWMHLKPATVPSNVGAGFTFKSSNEKIAKVDAQGAVHGLKVGSANITISAKNLSASAATTTSIKVSVVVPVTSVRMDASFTVFVGKSRKMKASVRPDNATHKEIRWASSNPGVATVDSSGVVRGVAPGTAEITATASGGIEAMRAIRVTHPVGSITLSAPVQALYAGRAVQIAAAVLPNTSDPALNWHTSSSKIATVNSSGLVSAKSAGTVKITASARDGSKQSGALTLRVVKPASSISIGNSLTLYTNGLSFKKLGVTASPSKSGWLSLCWTSEIPAIAKVDQNGMVTAVADGTTVIYVSTDSGIAASCSVTVLTYPSFVKLELPADVMPHVKQKLPLAPYVKLDGSMKALSWKTSNQNLATIDKNGVLSAKRPGRVKVTVTTAKHLAAPIWIVIAK